MPLLLAALLLAPLVSGAQEAEPELVALAGSVPAFIEDALDAGPADPRAPMTLAIALRLRDPDGLAALADEPRAPRLTAAEVAARFGPHPGAAQAVAAWASAQGLGDPTLSSDGTVLTFRTSVGAASAAFRVPLRHYAFGDITLRSHAAPPLVPAALAPAIEAVVGLTDAPLRPLLTARDVGGASDAPPYGPTQLRAAYDVAPVIAAGYDGAGRVVAVTTWGAASQASLDAYAATYGLPPAALTHVDADGGAVCGAGHLEWDMDVQLARAIAPGAAVRVYCGADASIPDMLAAIARVVNDDIADVVSQSWGTCELFVDANSAAAFETKFVVATAQGIAFFTASGDGGSRECTRAGGNAIAPSWPATAPHTTSVGGTRLTLAGGGYAEESTWNTCAPCGAAAWSASGGGPSVLYPRPAWQSAPAGATRRASADISAVADPATGVAVRHDGAWWQVGGTSAASPIAAGTWTLLVQRHGRLGHAAQGIWPHAGNASALRDITTGHNGDFAAGPGYDHPTGLGSPRAAGLLQALALPRAPVLAAQGAADIQLTWSEPAPGAAPIQAYRVYGGDSPSAKTLLATVTQRSFTDAQVTPGVARWYQVSAVNGHGEGPLSAERTARAYSAPLPPRAFSAATGVGVPTVLVTWSAPANAALAGVSGYHLYRDGELLDSVATTSYNDDLCALGTTCRYHATAIGVLGESAPSSTDSERGLSPGVATSGTPTSDPADAARLTGHERLALAMDGDDALAPAPLTRDASPAQQHALVGSGASAAPGRHGGGYHLAPGAGLRVPSGAASSTLTEGTIMLWIDLADPGALVTLGDTLALDVGGDGALSLTIEGARLASPPGAMRDDAWVHVAATWAPGARRLYVDGALVAADARTSVAASAGDVRIGAGASGTIDEARLYDAALPSGLLWSVAQRPYSAFPRA